ncbi:hypothetical protein [Nocardia asteroides]|uniref:Roadblock/LAMTOR2 domain-containing protein n=1 Tax=Nocardia asteroides NBRC 15531 TaxID=1110697 RepID=U5EKT0_NOCAS|nr:hypothetical protein [Nocardia asteroides]TLF67513.1 hypothetical protein FEK33_16390 [Nocardia asteroides NBRC 15531]UGT50990.1 hypothetical protein LT345_10830 [Nocardia asteroides]SFN42508.1 hypothetical protein SAMN05444423_10978 [Nocardia asteroides]VEG36149.1 Uncharacterised protein [Nocardia asteroides]GAD85689.1 hypothetical protein NCAST_32_01710 [Nocardia asteroides NBRC 15531]
MNANGTPASMSERLGGMVKSLRGEVPDCVAAGVIDMSTGMLLAVETVDNHPPEVLDLLAAATLDLFQGRNVVMIEDIWKERRGIRSDDHYFQEILVNSNNLTHLFLRAESRDDLVVVVVCRKSVNVGMLFAQSRRVLKDTGRL